MRFGILLILCMALTGCRYFGNASKTELFLPDGERKPAPRVVELIAEPRNVREDITYPAETRQSFYWRKKYAEWRFHFPARGYAYAGFRITIPLNLSHGLDKYSLSFEIRPRSKAKQLWIALIDGEDQGDRILTELPIKKYMGNRHGKWGYKVNIPIRDFPQTGIPVQGEKTLSSTDPMPFDWKDVRQIRIINHSGNLPSGDIVVNSLRFKR